MNDKLLEFIQLGSRLYKIIEERDLAYQLARKLLEGVDISENELEQLKESIDDWFDYNREQKDEIKTFVDTIKSSLENSEFSKKGAFLLIFLLAWNMNRFKDCSFTHSDLLEFAKKLNEKINSLLEKYNDFYDKTICDLEWNNIKSFLSDLENILRFRTKKKCFNFNSSRRLQKEWVGSFKIAHLLFPTIFIPLDNSIAEGLKIKEKRESWNVDGNYKPIWEKSKEIFGNYEDSDILKKLDEALYMIFSTTEKKKAKIKNLLNLS